MNFYSRSSGLAILSMLIAGKCAAQQPAPVTVKVGDLAPAMDVKKWVKGTPVKELGHGKVNVVEFWATWCGPCKTSIPHLTELAHKYKGKATFTGVSVFEDPRAKDESYLAKVKSFVEDMGPKMDYNVAADGLKASMANHWMIAAGQEGIPTAFVVDREGRIAWIGHPMMGLDEIVQKVVDGSFDMKAEASKTAQESEKKAKAKADSDKLNSDAAAFVAAARAGKLEVAVQELDKLFVKHPEAASQLALTKFSLLAKLSETSAYEYGKALSSGILKNDAESLNTIAWQIVDDKTTFKHPNFAAAVIIAKQSAEASQMNDPMCLDTYAYALFKNGDKDGAIGIESKAVALCERMKDKLDPSIVKEIKDRLITMKSKPGK